MLNYSVAELRKNNNTVSHDKFFPLQIGEASSKSAMINYLLTEKST